MTSDEFNPTRLDLARRRRGFTKRYLASQIGVTPIALSAYGRGDYAPSNETVLKLSRVLGFPTKFFFGDDLDEIPEAAASFRASSKLSAREKHEGLAAGEIARMISDWLADRFILPPVSVPRLEGMEPEAAAESVRSEWGLGVQPVENMIQVLELHGIRVFSLVHETRHLDAFSFWRSDIPYVFLNTEWSGERSRMDAAHELGHLVLHWNDDLRGANSERDAKRFAAAFLMPRESVIADAPKVPVLHEIMRAKHYWGVAITALTYRMHELKLISDWQYHALFQQMSRLGYRVREPEPMESETSGVLDQIFSALANDGISMPRIADDLGIMPEELYEHVFQLTLTPVVASPQGSQHSSRPFGWN